MREANSSSDRLERWRALLSGADSLGVRGQALRRSGEVNLLTGVWLHAAARAEQGLELTELERSLLAPLEEVLSGEEVRAVGRLYREQVGTGDLVALVPQSVVSRSLQDGFDREAFWAAMEELHPQIMALPNVAVVDRARLADSEDLHTPEFTAAMAEAGFGVTGFASSEDRDHFADTPTVPPFRAVLEWGAFKCHEAWGDQWGGDDEIYFTAVSKAATYEHTTRTAENKGVEDGGYYRIPGDHATGNRAFFSTQLSGCGSVAITMWEADDSTKEWYDALGNALKDAAKILDDLPWWVDLVPTPKLYDYVTLSIKFLATFWEAWRNDDDKGLTHAFVFGPKDLLSLYTRSDRLLRMDYNARSTGQGHFALDIKYTGEQPQLPPPPPPTPPNRTLRMATTTDGRNWGHSTSLSPFLQATNGPTLAAVGDSLHCVARDFTTSDLMHMRFDGTTWGPPSLIPTADLSTRHPVLAVFNERLHCVTAAMTGDGRPHLAYTTLDGDTWNAFTRVPMDLNLHSQSPLALAVFDNRLYCFGQNNRQEKVYTTFDGTTWSYLRLFSLDGEPAAAAAFRGKLHYVTHSSDHERLEHRTFDGSSWSYHTPIAQGFWGGPALTVHDDRLHCIASSGGTGPWGKLMHTAFDGHTWSDVRDMHDVETSSAPALASLDGALSCVFRTEG
ncbi:hypothetical protein AB0I99_14735 [Streptomyces spongiicola]|uniref:hypothetical protein n=1 Tax=Streptomyces spongiicola TaxID=1690221 RepID=UPI0033DAF56E